MDSWPNHPRILEINSWVWLHTLTQEAGAPITLGNIPVAELERLAALGIDGVWLMGLWQRSARGRDFDRQDLSRRAVYIEALPDFRIEDIVGSPYAVFSYCVDPALGGNEGLAALREQLKRHGLRLILDFVSNHLALDHPWLQEHPQRFIQGDYASLISQPGNYYFAYHMGELVGIFAHGKDPYFPGWQDTVQLDYRNPDTRQAMSDILYDLAKMCDGLRCDLAMLITHDVFLGTWHGQFEPPGVEFWTEAIRRVKADYPHFLMIAEVYWNLEHALQQQGFDYTYDKTLYDRLGHQSAESVHLHLTADLGFQNHLLRFIENHDEARAIAAFGQARSLAAATIAMTLPGMRLIHEGQVEGRRKQLPVQLGRSPVELPDPQIAQFYQHLLSAVSHPVFQNGHWQLLEPHAAWAGNLSYKNFVAFGWELGDERRLIVVNLSAEQAQCYLPLKLPELAGCSWHLNDLLADIHYLRFGHELLAPGLYLDMPGYGHHLFGLQAGSKKLPSAVSQLGTFSKHQKGIYTLAWSRDGSRMASSGEDQVIWIWRGVDCKDIRQLKGHRNVVDCVAWSPDGKRLASGSDDHTIIIWDVETGRIIRILREHTNNVVSLCWSPDGRQLMSGSLDQRIIIWKVNSGEIVKTLDGHTDAVNCLIWSNDGKTLISGGGDNTIRIWDAETYETTQVIEEPSWISSLVVSPQNDLIVIGTGDGAVSIREMQTGQQVAICEGHSDRILCVTLSADGRLLASKSADDTIRFWKCDGWQELLTLREEFGVYLSGIAFHPREPILATRDDKENVIRLLQLNINELFSTFRDAHSVHYSNAKVILVGEPGTGKTCLARALMGEPFEPQPATNARKVWTLSQETLVKPDGSEVIQEILLWDFAGQPDYRLIHQLHFIEVAVALVLFESRSQTDPFASVHHWDRALRQAQRVQGALAVPLTKLLVVGRTDVGSIGVHSARINSLMAKLEFDAYFETSAKAGRNIPELAEAIRAAINWDALPIVSSTQLFQSIKSFLVSEKESGRLLSTADGLYRTFTRFEKISLQTTEFNTCIGRVEARGLIQRLSFGNFVLLQPELLDAYAAALVIAAKEDPDGFGYISEAKVFNGDFNIPEDERIKNKEQEKLLLIATVEDLLRHEIAFRETGYGEAYLVFPSQLTRELPELPDPASISVILRFEGPVLNIYATLAVRLSHSDFFKKQELWKNSATYQAIAGGLCGIFLHDIDDGCGELTLFFDEAANEQTRFEFEEYVYTHLKRRALPESLRRRRIFSCPECKTPVSDTAMKQRRQLGFDWLICNVCEKAPRISLLAPEEHLSVVRPAKVTEMNQAADSQRDRDTSATILRGKMEAEDYDVFLCHNTEDKEAVKQIGERLKEQGILPWLDEWDLTPGVSWQRGLERQIEKIKSAAVFVGSNGFGPWQREEVEAFLDQFAQRDCPVIPVLLAGAPAKPPLPIFLKNKLWVDFRKYNPDPMKQLIRGITGVRS